MKVQYIKTNRTIHRSFLLSLQKLLKCFVLQYLNKVLFQLGANILQHVKSTKQTCEQLLYYNINNSNRKNYVLIYCNYKQRGLFEHVECLLQCYLFIKERQYTIVFIVTKKWHILATES